MNQQESAAFRTSIRTSDRALREVERLKRQCLVLARHVGVQHCQLDLARRIIAQLEYASTSAISSRGEHAITVLRQAEEIEHLRDELRAEHESFAAYRRSTDDDSQAVADEAWRLMIELRDMRLEIDALRKPGARHHSGAVHSILRRIRSLAGRALLIPLVGWSGARELEAALNA